MLRDLKTGVMVFRKTADFKYVAVQIFLFIAALFLSSLFVNPLFNGRIKTVFGAKGDNVSVACMVMHTLITFVIMKKVIFEAYQKDSDLFYQLTLCERAGCVCVLLEKMSWYFYYMVMLLLVRVDSILPVWAAVERDSGRREEDYGRLYLQELHNCSSCQK